MVNEYIPGTYYLCRNKDNSLWITQSDKVPERNGTGGWMKYGDGMTWIYLDTSSFDDWGIKNGQQVHASEFLKLDLPKDMVTWERGPLEIEIGKTGKVYWYE